MNDRNPIEAEASRAVGWVENHIPGHARPLAGDLAQRAAAAQAGTSASPQPEVPVSAVGAELHHIAAVFEVIGDDAAAVLKEITDHPEGVAVLRAVAAAMGIPLPVGAITAGATAFKIAVSAFEAGKAAASQAGQQAAQQPSFTPAPGTGAQPTAAG